MTVVTANYVTASIQEADDTSTINTELVDLGGLTLSETIDGASMYGGQIDTTLPAMLQRKSTIIKNIGGNKTLVIYPKHFYN